MSIFDAFSGNAYKKTAKQNTAAIQQGLATGTNALTTGANNALATLGTPGQSSALAALDYGYAQGRNDMTAGYDRAAAPLAKLGSSYNHMVQGGQGAFDRYLDATGANGAAGSARAQDAFRAGPGYEFQRDQALEAIQRTAAARGGLAGGNTTRDLLATATGLADQSWNGYVSGLGNAANAYGTGLAGQAQGLTTQANAAIGQGTALAQLGQSQGRDRTNIYSNAANIQNGLGGSIANLNLGATNALVANNNAAAKGATDASGNVLGALLGGAQSVFGAAGQAGGFKNLFTNPFA